MSVLNRQRGTRQKTQALSQSLPCLRVREQITHHHTTRVTQQVSHQSHRYSLGFSGCSWGHSASVQQMRRAAWVASYRQSKRIILLPTGILSSISRNNHRRPQRNPNATVRGDAVILFSLKHPERTGLTRKIGQQSLRTVEFY